MKIEIEKNIPVPVDGRSRGRGEPGKTGIFHDMEVGDSVLISDKKEFAVMGAAASTYGLRHKKKFTRRIVEGGIRIWRIA